MHGGRPLESLAPPPPWASGKFLPPSGLSFPTWRMWSWVPASKCGWNRKIYVKPEVLSVWALERVPMLKSEAESSPELWSAVLAAVTSLPGYSATESWIWSLMEPLGDDWRLVRGADGKWSGGTHGLSLGDRHLGDTSVGFRVTTFSRGLISGLIETSGMSQSLVSSPDPTLSHCDRITCLEWWDRFWSGEASFNSRDV